jgi:hypothetical protein
MVTENHRIRRTAIRWTLGVGLLTLLCFLPIAVAQQGVVEECQIDEYQYEERQQQLYISGTATCSEARLELTVYDDASGEQLASDFTYIMDGSFEISMNAPVPEAILVEYTIE